MIAVSVMAAIKDIYQSKTSIAYAYMMSCSAVIAFISVNVTLVLKSHFSWHSISLFYILFLGVLLIIFSIRFKETLLVKNKQKLWNKQRINLLKNPSLMASSFLLLSGYVVLMSFLPMSICILVNVLSIEFKLVGLYLSIFPITIVMSSLCSVYIIKQKGEFFLGVMGMGLLLIGLLIMHYCNQLEILSLWGCFIPVSIIIIISSIFLINSGQGAGMSVCQNSNAGFTASILGFFRYSLGGILCSLPILLDPDFIDILLMVFSISGILACFSLWILYHLYDRHDLKWTPS